jgi:hypothetical protein
MMASALGLVEHLAGQRFQSSHAESLDLAGELLGVVDRFCGRAMALAVAVSAIAVGAACGSRDRSSSWNRFVAGNAMLGQFVFDSLAAGPLLRWREATLCRRPAEFVAKTLLAARLAKYNPGVILTGILGSRLTSFKMVAGHVGRVLRES